MHGIKGFQKGHPQYSTYKFPKGHIPWNKDLKWSNPKKKTGENLKCLQCNSSFYASAWWIAKNAKYCSCQCYWESKIGLKPWNDKGISPLRERLRRNIKYKKWHEAILKRDNYNCKSCGYRGGELTVDHIKPFALYPELRFDLNNGQTLCRICHNRKTAQDWKLYPMWHGGIYARNILGR